MTRFDSQVSEVSIDVASEQQALISPSRYIALDDKELSVNNSDGDNGCVVNTVDEDSIIDEIHGEEINNNFRYPMDAHKGVTGFVFEEAYLLLI